MANSSDATVTEINASDGSVVDTFPAGNTPVAVTSDGTDVWVANQFPNAIIKLAASDRSVIQTIPVGLGPCAVTADSTHVWMANQYSNTINEIAFGFENLKTSLPAATRGMTYGPVSLQTANLGVSTSPYTTTLKWKKVTLPKGLQLSKTGLLSGIPNTKLAAGASSVTVQVTETVTTLNGTKKAKTKTTVQATIPLTIT